MTFRNVAPSRALVLVAILVLALPLLLDSGAAAGAQGASVTEQVSLTDRLQEYTLNSEVLGGTTTVRVLEPVGVEGPVPVLYLLHGCCDDYTSWTREVALEDMALTARMLVVMPDGGQGGWYTDWINGPAWETFHNVELRDWVAQTYDVRTDRDGNAIVGLSMGGFGAMSYAARYPDLYGFAAAFSGAVDLNVDPVGAGVDATSRLDGGSSADVFGPRLTDEIQWRGHNPWDLASNLANTELVLRTRNGLPAAPGDTPDALEIYVHEQMVSLHERLRSMAIHHQWLDEGPGGHDWDLWAGDLAATLPRLAEHFAAPPRAVPTAFRYRSISDDMEIFGWEIQRRDLAREFANLIVRNERDFSLTASGQALVRTPAAFEPGRAYQVLGADRYFPQQSAFVMADADGRLEFEVRLSAANEVDEGSPSSFTTTDRRHTLDIQIR